MSNWIS